MAQTSLTQTIVILISLCQWFRRQRPPLVETVSSLWARREGGDGGDLTTATWAGISVQKNVHVGWSNLPSLNRVPLAVLFMWSYPSSPPTNPPHSFPHKKPLTRRTKFHWPSFVDLSGIAAVLLFFLKHFVELVLEQGGCGLWSLPPPRHTGRASAMSSMAWAGAKTRLNDIFVPKCKSLGV